MSLLLFGRSVPVSGNPVAAADVIPVRTRKKSINRLEVVAGLQWNKFYICLMVVSSFKAAATIKFHLQEVNPALLGSDFEEDSVNASEAQTLCIKPLLHATCINYDIVLCIFT